MAINGATRESAYWHQPARLPLPVVLEGDVALDVAIVGGGYSGLSAAYYLKRRSPGLSIGVFEARRVSEGASGVNSGQCSPRVGPSIEVQAKRLPASEVAACYGYSLEAMSEVRSLVEKEGIACEMAAAPQLQLALTRKQAALLERRARLYRQLKLDVPMIGTSELRAMLPQTRALNALCYPAYSLNPAQLSLGLKQSIERAGVHVFEASPVARIDWGRTLELHCLGHRVRARQVVVATDGSASQLGLFGNQIFPVRTFCAATRPLSTVEFAGLCTQFLAGFYDSRHAFNFVRFTADRRLLIGGEYRYSHAGGSSSRPDDPSVADRLIRELARFFPDLQAGPFESVWSGLLGCTLDGWPVIAPIGEHGNGWFVGAWNGHGVALATASGKTVTQYVMGERPVPRPWLRSRVPAIPAPFTPRSVIAGHLALLKLKDQVDQLRERLLSTHHP